MKREIQVGKTDYSALVFIPDPAQTDGSGKTGLVAANLTVSGARMETDNDATVIDYTSSLNDLAALTSAHADWGLKEISSTLAPGLYRLDIADAIFASGAWTAVVYVMITTSAAAPSPMEFVLVAHDPDDLGTKQSGDGYAVTNGRLPAALTADGNIKADTLRVGGTLQTARDIGASVLLSSGTGTGQIVLSSGKVVTPDDQKVDVNTIKTQALTVGAAVTILASVGTAATSTAQTGDSFGRLGAPAGASVSADVAAVKVDTAAIKTKTDSLTFTVAGQVDSNVITKTGFALTSAYDFAKGTVAMTESYAANGIAPTPVQAQFAIHQMLMDFAIATTAYTVKKLNNVDTAFVVTLDDASNPTSAART